MGFFSWKTCDKDESIANIHSGVETRPVYLLQPFGQEPIEETAYKGYGVFGGIDAFVWLAENNIDKKRQSNYSDEERRLIGIELFCGIDFYRDSENRLYVRADSLKTLEAIGLNEDDAIIFNHFAEKLSINDKSQTINEHVASGELINQSHPEIAYPLKFSFEKSASYDSYKASESCENQGYFYE